MNKTINSVLMKESLFPSEPIHYVQVEFENRRKRNPNYSARAFARDLNLSPSHLSEFLAGKSKLSPEKATHLGRKLKLNGTHFEHWCDLLFINSRIKKDRDSAKFRIQQRLENSKSFLSVKVYEVISDWHHFAILTYLGANAGFSAQELSQKLGLSKSTVEQSLQTLLELKLLAPNEHGYSPTEDYSLVGNSIPSEAIRESHKQILDKAKKALNEFEINDRESQSLFLSLPKNQLASFRQEVKSKILQIAAEYSKSNLKKEELSVQALTLQVFPISEKNNEN